MKAVLHYRPDFPHQKHAAEWMAQGLARHGFETAFAGYNSPEQADLAVIWTWRQQAVIEAAQQRNTPILVMERGNIQPRTEWVSCGFNGLGRRGIYPPAPDGERWQKYFAHNLMPWRLSGAYALICAQPYDVALYRTDLHIWAERVIQTLRSKGYKILYRPHPDSSAVGDLWVPENVTISSSSLSEDFSRAQLVVVYNSAAGVESVLAGIPTVTFDEGAMAWPVATHNLDDLPIAPDRTKWCHDLAWTQWLPAEIRDGTTWDMIKACVNL